MHVTIRDKRRFVLGIVRTVTATAILALAGDSLAPGAAPQAELPRTVRVAETFNGVPFEYRIESRQEGTGYTIYRLTYPSPVVTSVPQNNTVPAEYYVPRAVRAQEPGRPGVVCMHILDGDFVLVRMTCSMLASHGIPAILFKLPYYDERGLPDGPRALAADPKLFVEALSQGLEDVRRTVDVLASRPEVDPERIGITGISLGGIVAGVSAGIEPRFERAMLILAGGDLNTIIHHAEETGELSQVIQGLPAGERAKLDRAIDAVDPLRHAGRLRDRALAGKVLMVNAGVDEVIPRACTTKLAAALGIEDRVVWLDGLGHYTAMAELPRVLRTAVDFFGEDMPPGLEITTQAPRARTPLEVVVSLIQQVSAFFVTEPGEGRCHFVDFSVTVTPEGDDTLEAWVRLIRGRDGRFKLEGNLPMVGDVALGQSDFPWMLSGRNRAVRGSPDPAHDGEVGRPAPSAAMLFKGAGEPGGDLHDPLAFVEPGNLMKLRMAAGAATGLAIAPHVLNQWLAVSDETPSDGSPVVRIVLKEKGQGSLRLVMRDDGKTPRQVTFDVAGVKGTVTFRGWQSNTVAHRSMFDPPSGLPEREVARADLYRVFSAMFDFAVESSQ